MISYLKALLIPTQKIKRDGREWDLGKHRGWGNNIDLLRPEKIHEPSVDFVGWISFPHVAEGDTFLVPMQSGRSARFVATEVKYQSDPKDMFFAKATPVGYADNRGADDS